METIIVVIFVATLIVSSVSIFVGLDLKKKVVGYMDCLDLCVDF